MQPGTEVAGYRIKSVLGQGGMGTVYEATQLSLNRTVALKILSPQFGNDVLFRERFRREGQIQAAIDHPHIVTVYEAGELGEGLFLAMRLVRGGTLKDMIVARELEGARTLRLLKPIADALDTAHEASLIHRDIKPQNILVGPRDHAYLADFGLTKNPNEVGLTKTGQFLGTIDYISPEQIRGEPPQAASDIYSLAAVLYECLVGVVPYPKPSDAAVLFAHMSDPPPLVTDQRPELPAALDEVIAKAMAKNPADRHRTAEELIQEAERAFGKRVRAVITPPGPVEGPEEIGLRDPESRVPTRETRIRSTPPPAQPPTQPPAQPPTQPPAQPPTQPSATTVRGGPPPRRPQNTPPTPPAPPPPATSTRAAPEWAGAPAPTVQAHEPRPAAPGKRRQGPLLAAAAVLIVLVTVAGFAVGRAGREEAPDAAALGGSASNQDVQLSFPTTWRRSAALPELPGLELAGAMAVGPGTGERSGLVVGRVGRTGAGLLPEGLLGQLNGETPSGERVSLGGLQALHYTKLQPGGGDTTYDLALAPTSEGTLAFACHAPAAQLEDIRADCARAARSVELVRGQPVAIDPSPEYAGLLSAIMTRLARERRTGRQRLASARSPSGQGSVAATLASNYAAAAQGVRDARTPPRAARLRNDLVAALTATSKAYSRLASAARGNNRAAFTGAASAVRRGETAVQRALQALSGAGYKVS